MPGHGGAPATPEKGRHLTIAVWKRKAEVWRTRQSFRSVLSRRPEGNRDDHDDNEQASVELDRDGPAEIVGMVPALDLAKDVIQLLHHGTHLFAVGIETVPLAVEPDTANR